MNRAANVIYFIITCFFWVGPNSLQAQEQTPEDEKDAFFVQGLFKQALINTNAYDILERMITASGARMSGSENYDKAVDFFIDEMRAIGFDSCYRQPCEVPFWKRGKDDWAILKDATGSVIRALHVTSLGGSCSSQGRSLQGKIIPFNHIDSIKTRPRKEIEGNIIYFNRPMDASLISPFSAYGRAGDQRVFGPARASAMGAAATIVRSLSGRIDYVPHTGITVFADSIPCTPAMAVSTMDAVFLDSLLALGQEMLIEIHSTSKPMGKTINHTVIGEIRGSTFPDEIILAGGHLDSWDLGDGAHDDGAGCAHAVEAFRLLIESGYIPKRTWRCVLFASEESSLAGGKEYARVSNEKNEFHLAAIESDGGGHIPRAFSFAGNHADAYAKSARRFWDILEAFDLRLEFTGGGADISRLQSQNGALIGLRVDPQRYFDYHHSASDVIEQVHPRELSLGAASMAALIYLIDKYGLSNEINPDQN